MSPIRTWTPVLAGVILATSLVVSSAVAGEKKAKKGADTNMVTLVTDRGKVVIELYPDVAPKTVENFKKLVKDKFYDKVVFHRVEPNFVVQVGDPRTRGVEGKDWTYQENMMQHPGLPVAGTGGPGYTIPAEFNPKKHLEGTVAMARTQDPNSAGSQFYICLAPAPFLDNQYTVFGQVTEGMDVVHKIQRGDRIKKAELGKK